MNVDLSIQELRMIRYWRESCHVYNAYCPLVNCLEGDEGVDFCHKTIQKVDETLEEELQRRKKQPNAES